MKLIKKYVLWIFSLIVINFSGGILAMEITSSAFNNNGFIPTKYTCDGVDISPQLAWSNVPKQTKSLALIIDDPDAPMGIWTHWILYNLPPDTNELVEEIKKFPLGTKRGRNSWGKEDYRGPCPPSNEHRYVFTLYALDTILSFPYPPNIIKLKNAVEEHVLDKAILIGRYRR